MKRLLLILSTLILLTLACRSSSNTAEETPQNSPPPAVSENRCGDDVCDGPENPANCPQDCPAVVQNLPDSEEEQQEQPAAEEQANPDSGNYRYVSFSGDISTELNTSTMGDFTGTSFEYDGEYSVELWFPMQGGQAVQQRNTLALTEFHDLYFGDQTCVPCEWNLEESAFEPVSFTLDATLTLNGIEEGGEPADELTYILTDMPMKTIGGICQCPCPGNQPGEFSDPAAYTTLFNWFAQGITDPIHIQSLTSSSVEQFPITPLYYINIPKQNLSYTTVPDLNTP